MTSTTVTRVDLYDAVYQKVGLSRFQSLAMVELVSRALQAYLGHRNIQHTVRYTELSPGRFKDFWR